MPLAAVPGYGEVHGLGDGLWLWFGADFATVNRLLDTQSIRSGEGSSSEQAQAYRQVLCLLLAQRRPAYYLIHGHRELERLADIHLPLLVAAGVVPAAMRDAAIQVRSKLRMAPEPLPTTAFINQKTKTVLRSRLATALGVESLYELDRIDMTARATIDQKTQKAVAETLRRLKDPEVARAAGTIGLRLLNTGDDLSKIVYGIILYEHTPQGNLLRLHADNYDEPLDVNEGIKLDLGSTAKLRATAHYLELVASIYQQYVGQPAQALLQVDLHPRDVLSHWVIAQLHANPHIALSELLDGAMARSYSASPYASFFTGGALHTFANFKAEDNHRVMSVQKALQDSVNLVFIRLMRDIVYHYLYKSDGLSRWMDEADGAKRATYLQRFADAEGQVYLRRFYAKYRGKTPQEILTILTQGVRPLARRLTTVYRSVYPTHDLAALESYLKANLAGPTPDAKELSELYDTYSLERFDLQDRGYIARMHPLELWLGGYLLKYPGATLKEVISASVAERQQVYRWLFKTRRWYAQEKRIRILIEQDAFAQIHAAWKRLGYPFETLTPSYASAIGASGDRPAALAELVGILMNDGVRYPMKRFDTVHFASGTPYETLMQIPVAQGQRVLSPEVARAALKALVGVVEQGTARRIQGAYKGPDGTPLVIAGKTGTGDHRREISGVRGQLLAHQVISRTATFAFIIGDRHFGVLTAYVSGPAAARYAFTSALPVQVLKSLAPMLEPMIARAYSAEPPGGIATVAPVGQVLQP
jgi:membrane peptidoglycan carboxypeptidase